MENYYQILGIDRNASEKEIKKAYKRLALQWHPDKNPDNPEEASQKFQKIAEAYQVLGISQSRRDYDEGRSFNSSSNSRQNPYSTSSSHRTSAHAPHEFFSFSFRSPEEIFAEFFGNDPFEDLFEDEFNPFFSFTNNFTRGGHGHDHDDALDGAFETLNLNLSFPHGQTYQTHVQAAPTSSRMRAAMLAHAQDGATESSRSRNRSKRSSRSRVSTVTSSQSSGSGSGGGRHSTVTCSSTTTRIVNGKKVTVHKKLENGVETTTVHENDVLTSRTSKNV